MKKKILDMFVCMLLIATAVPAAESLKNGEINATISISSLASTTADWTQMYKLLASDGQSGDFFGYSVSISGNTALIGAWRNDDLMGSAYVFIRIGTTWIQQQQLLALDGEVSDWFGRSVSLYGDTAIIGAPNHPNSEDQFGAVYVFTRTGTIWTQQQELLALDPGWQDNFGWSVSISGDTALIGVPYNDDNGQAAGSAYVFTRIGTTWTQQQKLLALDGEANNHFGYSVFLSGDTALIGTEYNNSAYVFIRTGSTWAQQQKLLASDAAWGFGCSVSLDGDTALIGAPYDDVNGDLSGSAYVFIRIGNIWTQQQKLLASDGAAVDEFGLSVSINGNTILIGAPYDDDNGAGSGSAYVFTRIGNTWTQQQKLLASDGAYLDCFGCSVSLSGYTALIGAYGYLPDESPPECPGFAYVFAKIMIPILDLVDIKGGLLGMSVVLTNFGEGTAENIDWEMNASGGLFYPRSRNGSIDALYPGQNDTIQIRPVLGLGKATITFSCKYNIVNLSYNVDFEVKQEWRNRAILFLDSFPDRIQPAKEWMAIENYSYFNRTTTPGVELFYIGINNMHNVRVVLDIPTFSQEIEFLAACKFTNGRAILHECGITKELIISGAAHWEVELVDGG